MKIEKYYDKNLKNVKDDTLINLREEILMILTKGQGTSLDDKLNLLCEIERELTLRES